MKIDNKEVLPYLVNLKHILIIDLENKRIEIDDVAHLPFIWGKKKLNYIKNISLYNEDETVNVVVEICTGTSDKNELVEPEFNRLKCVR